MLSVSGKGTDVGERLNFADMRILVADPDRYSSGIVGQILRGFGVPCVTVLATGEAAMKQLVLAPYDLLITECTLSDMKAARLIRWARRHTKESVRYLPIILLTGYTHFSNVVSARDCGVNSVVRKPVSPATLFDHIAWSGKTDRPFVEADRYSGPCRRFRYEDAVPGLKRRFDDPVPDSTESLPAEAQQPAEASS